MTSRSQLKRKNTKVSACICGHLEEEHGSRLARTEDGLMIRLPHDGNCCCGDCSCSKFNWDRWLTTEELEDIRENKAEVI